MKNTGDRDGNVGLELRLSNRPPLWIPAQSVALSERTVFDVPVTIPRDLPVDSLLDFEVTARASETSRTATANLVGMIRKPRLCTPGDLTRAQYGAKLAQLRATVAAGALTPAQLDR